MSVEHKAVRPWRAQVPRRASEDFIPNTLFSQKFYNYRFAENKIYFRKNNT